MTARSRAKAADCEPVEGTGANGTPIDLSLLYFVQFGLPSELMPADLIDRARVYIERQLFAHAVPLLEAALVRTRQDRVRIGDSWTSDLVRLDDSAKAPARIKGLKPEYPYWALERRDQGVVEIDAIVLA